MVLTGLVREVTDWLTSTPSRELHYTGISDLERFLNDVLLLPLGSYQAKLLGALLNRCVIHTSTPPRELHREGSMLFLGFNGINDKLLLPLGSYHKNHGFPCKPNTTVTRGFSVLHE